MMVSIECFLSLRMSSLFLFAAFLAFPFLKAKVNKTAADEHCRCKLGPTIQYDLAVASIRFVKWAKLACD